MKDLCCDLLPDERIRVFISSAQNEENGFQWEPLRRRIKETLKSCPFLSPFIIEDSPSELPSTQRFMQQVIRYFKRQYVIGVAGSRYIDRLSNF